MYSTRAPPALSHLKTKYMYHLYSPLSTEYGQSEPMRNESKSGRKLAWWTCRHVATRRTHRAKVEEKVVALHLAAPVALVRTLQTQVERVRKTHKHTL